MKLVPTFVVVASDARNGCTQYLDATGKRRARWEHAHKFISRGAAEEFAAKHNGRVLEYAARAVEE
jgi:nitrous oxide reductase accessory protein NosL